MNKELYKRAFASMGYRAWRQLPWLIGGAKDALKKTVLKPKKVTTGIVASKLNNKQGLTMNKQAQKLKSIMGMLNSAKGMGAKGIARAGDLLNEGKWMARGAWNRGNFLGGAAHKLQDGAMSLAEGKASGTIIDRISRGLNNSKIFDQKV